MKFLKFLVPLLVISGLVFILVKFTPGKKGAIQIEAAPGAKVFINGQEMGTTPYSDEQISSGDLDLRLEPQGVIGAVAWERRLMITPQTQVVIYKSFAVSADEEESQILYWEKTGAKKNAGLVLTSIPEGVSVSVDGQMRGFAPLNLEDIGSGEHKLILTHPGYKSGEIMTKTLSGYRLVIEIKLAKGGEVVIEEEEEREEEEDLAVKMLIINDTPTGWLRVRDKPSSAGQEIGRVTPGEEFELLDEDNNWYKIEYESEEEGWISGEYATKKEGAEEQL